jgi:type IV secretory pathway VirB6-like protein
MLTPAHHFTKTKKPPMLARLAAFCLLPLMLAACDGPCFQPEDLLSYDYDSIALRVAETPLKSGGWVVLEGVSLRKNQVIELSTSGTVDLCPNINSYAKTLPADAGGERDCNPLPCTSEDTAGVWQNTGYNAVAGEMLNISVSGQFSEFGSPGGRCLTTYWNGDGDCYSRGGRGAFFYIGKYNDPPKNGDWQDPVENGRVDETDGRMDPYIRELYNYSTGASGYRGPAARSGPIYIIYAENRDNWDEINAASDSPGDIFWGNYYNNKDGYSFSFSSGCLKSNGQFLVACFGESATNCEPVSVTGNNGVWRGGAPRAGKVFLKIMDNVGDVTSDGRIDGDGNYANNLGKYYVNSRSGVEPPGFLSEGIAIIINKLRGRFLTGYDGTQTGVNIQELGGSGTAMDSLASKGFKNISQAGSLLSNIVRSALVLYVILYAIAYVMGSIKDPIEDFMVRLLKFSLVVQLLAPDSWGFFYDHFFVMFTEGGYELMSQVTNSLYSSITGQASSATNPFRFIDSIILIFASDAFWFKVFGLLFTAIPLGFIYVNILAAIFWYYFRALFECICLYIISMVALALLITVAPLFISLWLFNYTKGFFPKWVSLLINYTIQPLFLITGLAIFNTFFLASLYHFFTSFGACWQCVGYLNFGTLDLGPLGSINFEFCFWSWVVAWSPDSGYGSAYSDAPANFMLLAELCLFTYALLKVSDWMVRLAGHISGNIAVAESSFTNAKDLGNSVYQNTKTMGNVMANTAAAAKTTAGAILNPAGTAQKGVAAVNEKAGKFREGIKAATKGNEGTSGDGGKTK